MLFKTDFQFGFVGTQFASELRGFPADVFPMCPQVLVVAKDFAAIGVRARQSVDSRSGSWKIEENLVEND